MRFLKNYSPLIMRQNSALSPFNQEIAYPPQALSFSSCSPFFLRRKGGNFFSFIIRNAPDPTEAVMIRGKGEGEGGRGYGSFQPLGYLIITASVEWGAFLIEGMNGPIPIENKLE